MPQYASQNACYMLPPLPAGVNSSVRQNVSTEGICNPVSDDVASSWNLVIIGGAPNAVIASEADVFRKNA